MAYITRLLETKSVEHAFAVHVNGEGETFIQMLSIGGIAGTVVDPRNELQWISRFKSKKGYLVHNHPSGNMTPSDMDKALTRKIREGLAAIDANISLSILSWIPIKKSMCYLIGVVIMKVCIQGKAKEATQNILYIRLMGRIYYLSHWAKYMILKAQHLYCIKCGSALFLKTVY